MTILRNEILNKKLRNLTKKKKIINKLNYKILYQHLIKLLVEEEAQPDGGLESLFSIIKHYGGNTLPINLNEVIATNYPLTSMNSLLEAASKYDFKSAITQVIDFSTIMTCEHPIILSINSAKNKKHFVVRYNYCEKDNKFLIWDSRYGYYHITIEEFKLLLSDNKCLTICPNENN